MKIAAIDQGTTSTRILVAEPDGSTAIRHSLRHRQISPEPGWLEHDPLELLQNIRQCLQAAGSSDAIGLANQGESCLAWDAVTLEPLSPVIGWQDTRTFAANERLREDGAESLTLERAGLPLSTYFSASKWRWLLDHLPAVRHALARGRLRLGTTDAFFLNHLSGIYATDVSTASRTSLMNLSTGAWDPALCHLFGIPMETLPEIRPTAGSFGSVSGVPVTASVVDQQAALFGHRCRHLGQAKITFGTGAFLLAVAGAEMVRDASHGLLPTVAWRLGNETTYALDGGVFHAGSALEWAQTLGLANALSDFDEFDKEPAIDRGLIFVPALSGLASPHWDASAGALWIGMSTHTTRRDLCQSLLEGIALRTVEVIQAVAELLPLSTSLSVDGGLSRSPYFV